MNVEAASLPTGADHTTAARSRTYQLLALGFAFPDQEFFESIGDGSFRSAILEACAGLPYDMSDVAGSELATVPESYTDFESEYIRLFDVGAAGPPCPLYGGTYIGDRMKVMEDATRFYNFFGLRTSEELRELPDHITTEMEFVHYLTFRQAESPQGSEDSLSLLRAQRDFLTRHLGKWVPRMELRLKKQHAEAFFSALVRFTVQFLERDAAYTTHLAS